VFARVHVLETTAEQHDRGLELSGLTADNTGATRLALEEYEATLFDVADA